MQIYYTQVEPFLAARAALSTYVTQYLTIMQFRAIDAAMYNLQLPHGRHGRHGHHGRYGHGGHGGYVGPGGHRGHVGQDRTGLVQSA